METKRKQFHVQFPEHLSEDEQREALSKLNDAFDRQGIAASYERVFWTVRYEEGEESSQDNITFDAPSTNGERVIERWRKRRVPTTVYGKRTLAY